MIYVAINDYLVEKLKSGYRMRCKHCNFISSHYFVCKQHIKLSKKHTMVLDNFDPYYHEGINWNQLR